MNSRDCVGYKVNFFMLMLTPRKERSTSNWDIDSWVSSLDHAAISQSKIGENYDPLMSEMCCHHNGNFCEYSRSSKSKRESAILKLSRSDLEPQEPSVCRVYIDMEVGILHIDICTPHAFF